MGVLACSLAALLLVAAPTPKYLQTAVQDDALFLHQPPAVVRTAARQLKSLGATHLRVTAGWSALAPAPGALRKPKRPFDATDSATYPQAAWHRLDEAIRDANQAGLKVDLDVAFWAPRWAVSGQRFPISRRHRFYPSPSEFGKFALAVARRYSGGFRDPTNRRRMLPAVRLYTPWNEPNFDLFLRPQWIHSKAGWRAESPHLYRALYEAAWHAIKSVSTQNQVLLGGLAPSGSRVAGRGVSVPPLEFVRALTCVNDDLRPLRVPECRHYRPLRADGFAHHPYSRYGPPGAVSAAPDDVRLADVDRLDHLLHQLELRGLIHGALPIYDTEYGYESRPPDPFAGVSPERQAIWMSWASYLAWRQHDTAMFSNFQLRDQPGGIYGGQPGSRRWWLGWQTGLFYPDGRPKPAAQAFAMPFWAQRSGTPGHEVVLLWGMVRPGDGRRVVRVEELDAARGKWNPVHTYGLNCNQNGSELLTDRAGVLQAVAPFSGTATYRLTWERSDGGRQSSVPLTVSGDSPALDPRSGRTLGLPRLVPSAPWLYPLTAQ